MLVAPVCVAVLVLVSLVGAFSVMIFSDPVFDPAAELSGLQLRVFEWMLCPPDEREPATKAGLCRELDISPAGLYRISTGARFRSLLRQARREADVLGYQVQELLDALYVDGKGGNVRSAELWLKHRESVPGERDVPVGSVSDMSDEELSRFFEETSK